MKNFEDLRGHKFLWVGSFKKFGQYKLWRVIRFKDINIKKRRNIVYNRVFILLSLLLI